MLPAFSDLKSNIPSAIVAYQVVLQYRKKGFKLNSEYYDDTK